MKKLFLLSFILSTGVVLHAQPWMPKGNIQPVKLSEAIANYKANSLNNEAEAEQGNAKHREGKDYLFQRWFWYWTQHLDPNGYIVSPMKTFVEWQRYMEQHRLTNAQAKTTNAPSNWVFQGPHQTTGGYGGIGRINVVAFDPTDSNTFYVGSAAGSTWKTTNGGASWVSLYDTLPTLGVADIKINPHNHNTVYVATGDGDAGDAYSAGVIKSNDGGQHWFSTGLNWPPTNYYSARSLLINPLDTSKLILASNNGIYKTNNAGSTWTNVAQGDFKQILYKPGDTSTIYGSAYVGNNAQLMLSTDGGLSWDTVTSFTNSQRINIAVCPAAPATVKAIVSDNSSGFMGFYSSTNSGLTYTATMAAATDTANNCINNILGYDVSYPTTSCGGQGWYDLCIAVDPNNPLNVAVGGVNTFYSSDGGTIWQIATRWWGSSNTTSTVHADKHYLAYNSLSGALFETCDGGVYKTYNPLSGPWTDLSNGIGITEFYKNAVDNGVDFCIGGAQDNGTKMVNAGVATDLTGGDGMQCRINFGDPNHIWYCAYQNGSVDMTRDSGANYHSITDTLHGTGAWLTPYQVHPQDSGTLILAYDRVFVSHNNGDWWTPISPVFDSNNYINTMEVSPSNPNYIYTVRNNYNTWKSVISYTTDFGISWDTLPVPFANFISNLTIDPQNEKIIWVTISGYGTGKVYRYLLASNLWINETGSLPDIPVNCLLIDTSTHSRYIGTDAAIYYEDSSMTDWVLFNNHLPAVHVTDLNINYRTKQIWAATFGRGMWVSNIADIAPAGLTQAQLKADAFVVFPDPNNGLFTIYTSNADFVGKEVYLKIISADARVVLNKSATFDNSGKLAINASQLKPGNYICEVSNKKMLSRCRFVVNQNK